MPSSSASSRTPGASRAPRRGGPPPRGRAAPPPLSAATLAGHVARTGEIINVADAYAVGVRQTLAWSKAFDASDDHGTRSVVVVPLQDLPGHALGALELINALDA